jgi:hypothetical protein
VVSIDSIYLKIFLFCAYQREREREREFDNIKLSLRVERGEGEGDAMSTLFKWTNSDSQRHCLLTCNFVFCWRGGESQ